MAQRKPAPNGGERGSNLKRSIDDYLGHVASKPRIAKKTIDYYTAVLTKELLPFCQRAGVTDLGDVDQKLVDAWTTDLGKRRPKAAPNATVRKKHLSVATVDSYARTVNQFWNWAREEGGMTHKAKAQRPNIPTPDLVLLEEADFEAMEKAARAERDKLIIQILWRTGLRAAELTGLTAQDLIESDRNYYLHVTGKGMRERRVPIPQALGRRLRRFIEGRSEEERETDRLWLSARRNSDGEYEPLEPSGLGQMLHAIGERAKVKNPVNPHNWRHSFATDMMRRGMREVDLQRILGHETLNMISKVYYHPTPSDLSKAMMKALKGKEE
jgi:integrase/recombinase XerD